MIAENFLFAETFTPNRGFYFRYEQSFQDLLWNAPYVRLEDGGRAFRSAGRWFRLLLRRVHSSLAADGWRKIGKGWLRWRGGRGKPLRSQPGAGWMRGARLWCRLEEGEEDARLW